MWNGTERRQHKRYGVKNSSIRYARIGWLPFWANYSERYLLLNISHGGLHFITREQLHPGLRLRMLVTFPAYEYPLKMKGKVVWVRKSEEHAAFRTGVAITHMGRKYREILGQVLNNAILENVEITTGLYLREIKKL